MEDIGFWEGISRDLLGGAGRFRLILQPLMAVVLGVRVGLADARAGRRPFLARLVRGAERRWRLIVRSVRYAWMPGVLALVMDGIFQYLTLGRVRPLAAVVVGTLLVWLPFTMARGMTNRFWRQTHGTGTARPA